MHAGPPGDAVSRVRGGLLLRRRRARSRSRMNSPCRARNDEAWCRDQRFGFHVVRSGAGVPGGMRVRSRWCGSTSPVIRIEPSTSRRLGRSITSEALRRSARLLKFGQCRPTAGPGEAAAGPHSGWKPSARTGYRRRPASPARPPAWSSGRGEHYGGTPDRSRPRRSALGPSQSGTPGVTALTSGVEPADL